MTVAVAAPRWKSAAAKYRPVLLIMPGPVTDQATGGFGLPFIVAENCVLWPGLNVGVSGVRITGVPPGITVRVN
jgi:hypothetical protein